jgi:nucleoside-diphosphate-sugar epimerase
MHWTAEMVLSNVCAMTLCISVLGASGVYGRHLLPRLVRQGFRVRALVRHPDGAAQARACGAEIRAADIFDEASLVAGLAGSDVAVNLATALRGGDYALNDRVRREGVPIFLRACERAGAGRVVQQSIAMINAAGDQWADEETPSPVACPPGAAAAIAAMREVEAAVTRSPFDWLILRGGLFYGPGTDWDARWFELARAGRLRLPADGNDYVSLIHIADMAAATATAIARGVSRQALIVSDDAPARWRDVLSFVAASVGAAEPPSGGTQGFPSWRVRNKRARETLAWAPFYEDYRMGLTR